VQNGENVLKNNPIFEYRILATKNYETNNTVQDII